MKLYSHMHTVKSLVVIRGKLLGIVVGQLRDETEGDQYNVVFIDKKGFLNEEWIHEKEIKAHPTAIGCTSKKTFQ